MDTAGRIILYNELGLQIFGINPRIGPGHAGGKIEQGDIVIIADNRLGEDDGNLTAEDLTVIGVQQELFKHAGHGLGFVTIGSYQTGKTAVTKVADETNRQYLEVSSTINGVFVSSVVDFEKNQLKIRVGDQQFDFFYANAAGHLVILEKDTMKVKFYQSRGFTARGEDIKKILSGCMFKAKGPSVTMPKILNKHITDFFPDSDIISRLLEAASNSDVEDIVEVETEINGIPVRCSIRPIIEKQKVAGAILKFTDISEIKSLTRQRDEALASVEYLERKLNKNRIQASAFRHIIGVSDKIKRAIELALTASNSNSNVFLSGESGTGKNLFAESIHRASPRRDGPFVHINCATIPENLLESELFGYEKGAFTGALTTGKPGKFEKADGGTLFLDEIAELPLTLQAKILHFLQNRSFTRIGGLEPVTVDVRIITASNRNLEELVAQRLFREDLYYRIDVINIHIPPLRERREDIEPLIKYLLPRICEKVGAGTRKISQEAIDALTFYDWKGNVRELENVLEKSIHMSQGETITVNDLPPSITGHKNNEAANTYVKVLEIAPMSEVVRQAEKQLIEKTLKMTRGSRKEAMKILQMGKTNFYYKLKKLGCLKDRTAD